MATKINQSKKVLATILFGTIITLQGGVFAQDKNKDKEDDKSNGLWKANGKDSVFTNRQVKINKNLKVLGDINAINFSVNQISSDTTITHGVKTDTATITGNMRVKGILHIGDSSLTIGGINPFTGNDEITSSGSSINFGSSGINFSSMNFGFGKRNPFEKIHLEDITANMPVRMLITNAANTSGLSFGIESGGEGFILQKMNKYLAFGTSNLSRFRIEDDGSIGAGSFGRVDTNTFFQIRGQGSTKPIMFNAQSGAGSTQFMVLDATGASVNYNIRNYGANVPARFEVREASTRPQLRLSRTNDFFTHFQTTTTGDLYISPRDNTQTNPALRERYVGINTTSTPRNTLEINSQATTTNQSYAGLKFTDLIASSPTTARQGNGVLSLDATGNVIYVPFPTPPLSSPFFNCTNTAANMTFDSRFNLNGNNFYFTGQGGSNNKVAVGYTCSNALTAKFAVLNNNNTFISQTI